MPAMAGAGRGAYLYLGLTLTCFLAILCIFVVDGYLGVYDTLYITYEEHEQAIEFESQQYVKEEGTYFAGEIVAGSSALYRYRIDNRTFSPREGRLTASLWKAGNKLTDLANKEIKIGGFESTVVEWTISSDKLRDIDAATEEFINYTVKINFDGKERRIVFAYRTRGIMLPKPVVPGM